MAINRGQVEVTSGRSTGQWRSSSNNFRCFLTSTDHRQRQSRGEEGGRWCQGDLPDPPTSHTCGTHYVTWCRNRTVLPAASSGRRPSLLHPYPAENLFPHRTQRCLKAKRFTSHPSVDLFLLIVDLFSLNISFFSFRTFHPFLVCR